MRNMVHGTTTEHQQNPNSSTSTGSEYLNRTLVEIRATAGEPFQQNICLSTLEEQVRQLTPQNTENLQGRRTPPGWSPVEQQELSLLELEKNLGTGVQ